MFKLEVKQILGTPNGLAWSQIHHFLPQEEEKIEKRGELVLLVSLGSTTGSQETSVLGREIVSRVHEEYFGNLDKRPMESLKESLTKVGQEKSRYFESPEQISLVALVNWGEVVYLGIWYRGRILLRRHSKTVTLLQGEGDKIKAASGFLKNNDLFLLATEDFLEKIPQGMITASLSTEDLETIAEVLTPVVHAREKQGSLAAVLVKAVRVEAENSFQKEKKPRKKIIDLRAIQKIVSQGNWSKKLSRLKSFFGNIFGFLRPRSSTLTVALGFLILLSASVFLGWKKKITQRQTNRINELTLSIEQKLETASMIRNLDPDSSLKLIQEAGQIVEELKKLSASKADNFQEKISVFSSSLGAEAVEPQLYYDLKLIAEGSQISGISADAKKTLTLDYLSGRLISLDLNKKSGNIIAGGEKIKTQRKVILSGESIYLVSESQISLLKGGDLVKVADLGVGDRILTAANWLGNLYLLDQGNSQIWKYPVIVSGLGVRKAWFKEDLEFSFDSVVDMAIDGNLWVLLGNGKINKFLSGRKDQFTQQLPSGIGKAKFLAISLEGENVSFWDEEKKTIWIFNKKGEFLQRIPVRIDQVRGLTFSSTGNKIFLFGVDKIFSFNVNP